MNFRKQDPSLNEQAHVADNTENKVENTVKHQVTKKKCPKIYRVIFFWIATIISISFLIAAIQAGMIQVVVIAIVWSVCLFILRNFAYKDLYSRMSMLSVVIATIAISYVAVSFKTDESTPMSQESNQIEETEKVAEVEIKDDEEEVDGEDAEDAEDGLDVPSATNVNLICVN